VYFPSHVLGKGTSPVDQATHLPDSTHVTDLRLQPWNEFDAFVYNAERFEFGATFAASSWTFVLAGVRRFPRALPALRARRHAVINHSARNWSMATIF
jgi:hypothetical protein